MNNALNVILKDFSFYLKVERRLSPNTVAAYSGDVGDFFSACDLLPREVDKDDIREYIASRAGKLSKRSQARLLSSLKAFFDWCIVEGERKDNPCDAVDFPKLGQYLPEVLSVEEVEAIMDSVDLRSPSGVRDRAILELLYGCGLRVSELCGLCISHVYLDEGFVRVVGKGDKERLVPLGEPASDAFRAYLEVRPLPAQAAYQDTAFLNLRGTPLSRVSVFKMIKKPWPPAWTRKSHPTASDTVSRPTSLPEVPICAWCRRCWATNPYSRRRFTPISIPGPGRLRCWGITRARIDLETRTCLRIFAG